MQNEDVPEDPEEKRQAILAAVDAGEPVVSVAKRFNAADRTIRRYRKRDRQQQADPRCRSDR